MSEQTVLPTVAPLSASIASHAFATFQQRSEGREPVFALGEPLEETVARIVKARDAQWRAYQSAIEHHRATAYRLLSRQLSTGTTLPTEAVRALLAETDHAVSAQTLSRWREHGLLRYRQNNKADASSVAAILIAALLHAPVQRAFLPAEGDQQEPLWWCWRQDAPDAPVVACPVPLPPDLPPTALLWTPWNGAAWDVAWLNVGQCGAIRWAGTVFEHDKLLWQIGIPELQRWVPDVLRQGEGLDLTREILHTLATVALLHLTRTRFSMTTTSTS